jgi:hypothetical protein
LLNEELDIHSDDMELENEGEIASEKSSKEMFIYIEE